MLTMQDSHSLLTGDRAGVLGEGKSTTHDEEK